MTIKNISRPWQTSPVERKQNCSQLRTIGDPLVLCHPLGSLNQIEGLEYLCSTVRSRCPCKNVRGNEHWKLDWLTENNWNWNNFLSLVRVHLTGWVQADLEAVQLSYEHWHHRWLHLWPCPDHWLQQGWPHRHQWVPGGFLHCGAILHRGWYFRLPPSHKHR